MMHRLAESGLRVPACATLLSRMETSPSQGVEMLVLADQDFEDMFLADTSIPLRRLEQTGTRSPDSASLYCEDTLVTTC